jgi:hypothetical protein
MLMPSRQLDAGIYVAGGKVTGSTTINGHDIPFNLTLSSRTCTEPKEFVASNQLNLVSGFTNSNTDEFTIYIANGSYAGTGNQVTNGRECRPKQVSVWV